jgi:hypothetical protein
LFYAGDRLISQIGIAQEYGEGIKDISNEERNHQTSNFRKQLKRRRKMKKSLLVLGMVGILILGIGFEL